jgi:hypothetical protein
MYRSRRRAERRRIILLAALGGGALLAALAIAFIALGAGSSGGTASGCAILDVSESTEDARGVYTGEFAKFATEIGNDGSGEICVILAAADPLAEAVPITRSIAPLETNLDTPRAPVEIEEGVNDLTTEVAEIFERPGIDTRGSGLIEAANVAAKRLEPGDRLLYLTDGLQWTRSVGHLVQMDLSPAGIDRLLERLRHQSLLPDLSGVTVEFPRLLYHPEGISVDAAQKRAVIAFWEAWADATGANLVFETPPA